MRVFVTGATGYIGSAVSEALVTAGHQVLGLVRSDGAESQLLRRQVEPYRGALMDTKRLAEAATLVDGVVHAAIADDANAGLEDAAAVHTMIEAMSAAGKFFVYTSSVWVLGNTGGKTVDEDAPLSPLPALEWRTGVEDIVREAVSRKTRGIIIRPGMVYGRDGGFLQSWRNSAEQRGVVQYPGDGENHWSMVHVDNLSALYLLAIEKAEPGTLLHGVHGKPVKVRKIAEAIAATAGEKATAVAWPYDEAALVLGPFAGGLILDQHISGERARKLLGWTPGAPEVLDEIRTWPSRRVNDSLSTPQTR